MYSRTEEPSDKLNVCPFAVKIAKVLLTAIELGLRYRDTRRVRRLSSPFIIKVFLRHVFKRLKLVRLHRSRLRVEAAALAST